MTPDSYIEKTAVFRREMFQIWQSTNQQIFGCVIPERASWTDLEEIISILNVVGTHKQSALMSLPGGGDLDFKGAEWNSEEDCIELKGAEPLIVKPVRLLFSGFSDVSWNFFWLQTGAMRQPDFPEMVTYNNGGQDRSYLIELGNGKYHPQGYESLLPSEYQSKSNKKRYVKWFQRGGDFLIYNKAAIYSQTNMQDLHYKTGYEKFHTGIKEAISKLSNNELLGLRGLTV